MNTVYINIFRRGKVMKNRIYVKSVISIFAILFFYSLSVNAQLSGDLFPSGEGGSKQAGPTEITSNSMDINLKGDTITLYGNVVVNNNETKITADKIIVYLIEVKSKTGGEGKKEAKKLIATGNVVILKKANPDQKDNDGEEKATSGKADYNVQTGKIVLTDDPVLFQGLSYIKGDKITLFRNSDRVLVEGNQSMGQASKMIFNPPPKKTEETKEINQ